MFKNTIGSRTEGHGFALHRKKKAENAYRKLKSKEGTALRKQNKERESGASTSLFRKKRQVKGNPYFKAQQSSQKELAEKAELRKVKARKQQERREALEKYTARKRVRNKKLCKKNYKGQPILSNQVDLLLEKIMASSSSAAGSFIPSKV